MLAHLVPLDLPSDAGEPPRVGLTDRPDDDRQRRSVSEGMGHHLDGRGPRFFAEVDAHLVDGPFAEHPLQRHRLERVPGCIQHAVHSNRERARSDDGMLDLDRHA